MILPIIQFGDPILRKRCRTVSEVTEEIRTLAEDMVETMHEAQGVGLVSVCMAHAAPGSGQGGELGVHGLLRGECLLPSQRLEDQIDGAPEGLQDV